MRETWAQPAALILDPPANRADCPACVLPRFKNVPVIDEITWEPSIQKFPRDSRILPEAVTARVEWLDDCSEADACADGVTILDAHMSGYWAGECRQSAIRAYRDLWNEINGTGSWAANLWVW